MTKAQVQIISLALLQEALFNSWSLFADNWIGSYEQNGYAVEIYDAHATDPWMIHCLSIQLGFAIMALSFLFVERNEHTKPLFWAWVAYFLIQSVEVATTGNRQRYELVWDGIMLVALFTSAILVSRYIIPWMKVAYSRWK